MAHTKRFFLYLLMVFSLVGTFFLPAGTVSAARPSISADSKYLDITTGCYVLTGNVRVEIGQRIITADKATVNVLTMEVQGQGHISLVSSEDDITFSGDSVTVIGRENTAIVVGHADFKQGNTIITSGKASYSWETKLAEFSQQVSLTLEGNRTKHDRLTYNVIDRAVVSSDPSV